MKNLDKNKIIRYIYMMIAIMWMVIVFRFSNEPAYVSDVTSLNITKNIIEIFVKDNSNESKIQLAKQLDPIIRKLAHFSLYAVGGFLIMLYINTYNIYELKKVRYSIYIGALYACTDEIHQIFIPGRAGEVTDVLLDSLGVATGVFICLLIVKIINKKINKNNK